MKMSFQSNSIFLLAGLTMIFADAGPKFCSDDDYYTPSQELDRVYCNDGLDNDEDGFVDCNGTEREDADPDCCVLGLLPDGSCTAVIETYERCPESSPDNPPRACSVAADRENCNLHN